MPDPGTEQPVPAESVPEAPSYPAQATPPRPAPQPALQPLRPTPIKPASRPRVAADSEIDTRVIVVAVGAVGMVLAVVILMMVVMFGGNSGNDRETAGGSSPLRSGESAGSDEPGAVNFNRKPAVEFGEPRTMSSSVPGVVWKEIRLSGDAAEPATQSKLWVYLPAGNHDPGSLGCVLIGPAGSRMVHGMELTGGDQAEHYPYAQRGFAVVAFEIDGALPNEEPTDDQFRDAYVEFTSAAAGVVNARAALQYATTELPEVDRDRIFVAGHSSAGTVALLCAAHVKDLAGCVAYAPCSDVEGFLSEFVGDFEGVLAGMRQYMRDGSPMNNVRDHRCPIMIFHAVDDQVVGVSESNRYIGRVKQAGGNITLQLAPRGGHYDAMINEGINKAIAWMNRIKPPASSAIASNRPSPSKQETLLRSSSSGSLRAHVHLKIISYPSSGNPEILARDALRPVVWAEPNSVRIDRSANELIIGVRITSVNTNDAKLRLERVGFVIGGASYIPVRN